MPSKPDCQSALRRKSAKLADGMEEDTFSSPVCKRESAELRRFVVISGTIQADFSALQTVWRRGRDSNPRYPFGYAGFQDRSHQPLGHLSDSYSFTTVRVSDV